MVSACFGWGRGVIEPEMYDGPRLYIHRYHPRPMDVASSFCQVSPEDIKAWLLTGLQEEDEEVKEVNGRVKHAREPRVTSGITRPPLQISLCQHTVDHCWNIAWTSMPMSWVPMR